MAISAGQYLKKGPFGEKIEKIFFYGTTEPFKEKLLLEYFWDVSTSYLSFSFPGWKDLDLAQAMGLE